MMGLEDLVRSCLVLCGFKMVARWSQSGKIGGLSLVLEDYKEDTYKLNLK